MWMWDMEVHDVQLNFNRLYIVQATEVMFSQISLVCTLEEFDYDELESWKEFEKFWKFVMGEYVVIDVKFCADSIEERACSIP
jgi:hypothetical protein